MRTFDGEFGLGGGLPEAAEGLDLQTSVLAGGLGDKLDALNLPKMMDKLLEATSAPIALAVAAEAYAGTDAGAIIDRAMDRLSDIADTIAEVAPDGFTFPALEHIENFGCCCIGCLKADTLATNPDALIATQYTDAINWGGDNNIVDTDDFNADGDLIIHYYFEPDQGSFSIFPRLEWTDYEEGQIREAFDVYETLINVEFVETTDKSEAEFTLNKINSFGIFLGVMNPPGEAQAGAAGFAAQPGAAGWTDEAGGGLEKGGYGWITIVHEFGHGLGLAHPHDNGGNSSILPGVNGDPQTDTGTFDLNQGVYTMLSYDDGWALNPAGAIGRDDVIDYGYIAGPMAVDIGVLQTKYGANTDHATGDDVYLMPDFNGPGTYFEAIWDAGGTDEMRYDGSRDAVIDLRAATLEIEEGGGGNVSNAFGIYGGYTIANGVVIENATGGSGDDVIVSNAADNVLTGNAGSDIFVFTETGGGVDTITDFEVGFDLVDLSDLDFARRDASISNEAGGVELTIFDQTIIFTGLERSDLSLSDFLLS